MKYAVRPVTTNCVFCSVYSHKERIMSTKSFANESDGRMTLLCARVGGGCFHGGLDRILVSSPYCSIRLVLYLAVAAFESVKGRAEKVTSMTFDLFLSRLHL